MKKRDLGSHDFLTHMLESANRVLKYTSGMSRRQFLENSMIQDAVIRNIEIIGEAANNLLEVDPEFPKPDSSIPFVQIYGMRNRICHGYFSVSLEMVWDAVEVDIPELRRRISKIVEDLPKNG
jgi:uncharacterized protein with HEPN domain